MIPSRLVHCIVILAAWLVSSSPAVQAAERPSLVFVMVDDLGKEWIGCYGGGGVQTPNIDALAAGGIRFENAYSMPQCTPTRVTLLTGKYPFRTGWVNHWDVPRWGIAYFDWKKRENMTWARLLQASGYATAAAGKWQINDFRVAPDALRKHGFDEWCMWTGAEGGNPPSGKRYWDPYINAPDGSKTYEGRFGPDVYCDFLLDFIDRHRRDPMALYFPMALTHGPMTTTPLEPDVDGKLDMHKAMVRYVDHLVGKIVAKLDEVAIRDRTIVIFTTDNGTAGGITGTRNGRPVRGGKGSISEAGSCAPFIVNCPGHVPAGVVSEALVDFTDLLPTFCELAGVDVPGDLEIDGVSLAPVLLGRSEDSPRDWILAMGHGKAALDGQGVRGVHDFADRGIRDKRYKVWITPQRKIERFHDLRTDPYEEVNLIDSTKPGHVAALRKFQAVLDSLPKIDARPSYEPRAANPWDVRPMGARGVKRSK